jgi:transposase
MRKPYRSDLTDAQWEVIKGLFPALKNVGRPRTVDLREVVNLTMLDILGRGGVPTRIQL